MSEVRRDQTGQASLLQLTRRNTGEYEVDVAEAFNRRAGCVAVSSEFIPAEIGEPFGSMNVGVSKVVVMACWVRMDSVGSGDGRGVS
jgi:hypothetical protein